MSCRRSCGLRRVCSLRPECSRRSLSTVWHAAFACVFIEREGNEPSTPRSKFLTASIPLVTKHFSKLNQTRVISYFETTCDRPCTAALLSLAHTREHTHESRVLVGLPLSIHLVNFLSGISRPHTHCPRPLPISKASEWCPARIRRATSSRTLTIIATRRSGPCERPATERLRDEA